MTPARTELNPIKAGQAWARNTVLEFDPQPAHPAADLSARNRGQVDPLLEDSHCPHGFPEIVGNSPELIRLLRRVESAAPTSANVLIVGETGSGKELIARALHTRSARGDRPLVKVNCGAIPAGLVESELFGHVKGAFTSASERRVGRFELADRGTLFLDEVGELPLETQVKLLRVLQEQEFEPVGSSKTIKVDVRIVAATNRDLAKAVESGTFRSDLYYRLNVIPLNVPALRNRRSDIPRIVEFFLEEYSRRMNLPVRTASSRTMQLLMDYPWPGNIRELQNVIERGLVLSKGSVLRLGPDLLPAEGPDPPAEVFEMPAAHSPDSLEEVQRRHILRVLARTGGVISGPRGAAAILRMNPNTLHSLMKRLCIRRAAHEVS
ncbi:MAG: sigma-54-dependent Fis family transcriptional regulator [Acidobacteria bacterium]|nr:sigma-54-dependent Fis family transcriptional regulator [Acidobacteriota bacterium]